MPKRRRRKVTPQVAVSTGGEDTMIEWTCGVSGCYLGEGTGPFVTYGDDEEMAKEQMREHLGDHIAVAQQAHLLGRNLRYELLAVLADRGTWMEEANIEEIVEAERLRAQIHHVQSLASSAGMCVTPGRYQKLSAEELLKDEPMTEVVRMLHPRWMAMLGTGPGKVGESACQESIGEGSAREESACQGFLCEESAREESACQESALQKSRQWSARREAAQKEQAARDARMAARYARRDLEEPGWAERAAEEVARLTQEAPDWLSRPEEEVDRRILRIRAEMSAEAVGEAAQKESARREAARQESARREAAQKESARREAAQKEFARPESARREAAQ
jgi:hypothetical protein